MNNSTYLVHHGIKGQHWGKRNGPPYPLDAEDHSSSERREGTKGWTSKAKREERKRPNQNESNEKKGLSDKQKKALKLAGATVGVAAVAAIAYYGVKSGKVQNLATVGKSLLPNKTTKPGDLGITVNPDHRHNNCKEVAEATIKRWLGVDETAVAGPKSVSGNLHDFIEKRGYNKAGVEWIKGETGSIRPDSNGKSLERVTRRMLKQFKDGDCGYVSIEWDPNRLKGHGVVETGHAFNWLVKGDKIVFFDGQPDPPITDASYYFNLLNINKEIEIVKIAKEAFGK